MTLLGKCKEQVLADLVALDLGNKLPTVKLADELLKLGSRLKLLAWMEETKVHKGAKRKEFFKVLLSGQYPRFTEAWFKGTEEGIALYPNGLEKLLKCWDDALVPYISRMEQAKEITYIVRDPERTKFWFKVGEELDPFAINSHLFATVHHERALRNIDISLGVLL